MLLLQSKTNKCDQNNLCFCNDFGSLIPCIITNFLEVIPLVLLNVATNYSFRGKKISTLTFLTLLPKNRGLRLVTCVSLKILNIHTFVHVSLKVTTNGSFTGKQTSKSSICHAISCQAKTEEYDQSTYIFVVILKGSYLVELDVFSRSLYTFH